MSKEGVSSLTKPELVCKLVMQENSTIISSMQTVLQRRMCILGILACRLHFEQAKASSRIAAKMDTI